jgi:hypothetical protein
MLGNIHPNMPEKKEQRPTRQKRGKLLSKLLQKGSTKDKGWRAEMYSVHCAI